MRNLAIYSIWLVSFLVFYLFSIQELGSNQELLLSWQSKGGFPASLDIVENLVWLFDRLGRFFYSPLGFPGPWDGVAIFLFLLGCYSLNRREKGASLVLLSPLILTLMASALQRYPFHGRLVVFLTPLFVLLIVEGMAFLTGQKNRLIKGFGLALSSLLIVTTLRQAVPLFYTPELKEEIRPAIEHIWANKEEGDKVYVYQRGNLQFLYYADRYGLDPDDYILGIDDLDHRDGPGVSEEERKRYHQDLEQLREISRAWILFSHTWKADEKDLVVNYMNCLGENLDIVPQVGASVYLYDIHDSNSTCP